MLWCNGVGGGCGGGGGGVITPGFNTAEMKTRRLKTCGSNSICPQPQTLLPQNHLPPPSQFYSRCFPKDLRTKILYEFLSTLLRFMPIPSRYSSSHICSFLRVYIVRYPVCDCVVLCRVGCSFRCGYQCICGSMFL